MKGARERLDEDFRQFLWIVAPCCKEILLSFLLQAPSISHTVFFFADSSLLVAQEVRFEHVTFAYPMRPSRQVLKDGALWFTINQLCPLSMRPFLREATHS